MSSIIDFRTLPNNVPVLCIPRVYANISEKRIRGIFNDLNMGEMLRIDMVSKDNEKGEKFNRVFIHLQWNKSANANAARERLLNGKEIKIIYDDPWFWKVSAYRETERKPVVPTQNTSSRKPTLKFDSDEEDTRHHHDVRPRHHREGRPRPHQDVRPQEDRRHHQPRPHQQRPHQQRHHQDVRHHQERHQDEGKRQHAEESTIAEKNTPAFNYNSVPVPAKRNLKPQKLHLEEGEEEEEV